MNGPEITILKADGKNVVLGLAPMSRDEELIGLILAEIDACAILNQIAGGFDKELQVKLRLVGKLGGKRLSVCDNGQFDSNQTTRKQDRLNLTVQIRSTPLSMLIAAPLVHEHTDLMPRWILLLLMGLIVILMASLAFLLKSELRVSVLRKQAAEEERLKRIHQEEMTEKLDKEIRERTRAQMSSARKNELLEGVREVLTDALNSTAVSHAAASGLAVAQKLTNCRFGVIGTGDGKDRIDVLITSRDDQDCGVDSSRKLELLAGADESFRTGQSRIVNQADEDQIAGLDMADEPGFSSWLFVPVRKDGQSFGMIILADKEGGFDQYDRMIVEDLAASLSAVFRQKKTEEALRISEEQNRTLVESITEGLVIVDKNLQITYINDNFLKLLNYDRIEVVHRTVMEFMDETNRAHLQRQWERRQAGEQQPYEIAFLAKDGRLTHTMIYPKAFFDENGAFAGALALLVDLSLRKKHEAQALQAQKLEAIGQLAAGIAHEINTPTNFVANNVRFFKDNLANIFQLMGLYEELKRQVEQGEDSSRTLGKIGELVEEADLDFALEELPIALDETLEGLDHIANIVRSMKEFAHPGLDEKILYNINDGLRNTATVSKNEWKYVAELDLNLESGLPLVMCVPSQINQVFLNIIVNAAHAIAEARKDDSPDLGRITVSTAPAAGGVEIRIADTGPGIPEEIVSRIFEPFFTTKEPGKGTGQGLAIAHSIITDNHAGSISVESTPGAGSVFVITLPLDIKEET